MREQEPRRASQGQAEYPCCRPSELWKWRARRVGNRALVCLIDGRARKRRQRRFYDAPKSCPPHRLDEWCIRRYTIKNQSARDGAIFFALSPPVRLHLIPNRATRLTGPGVVMAHGRDSSACWVIWIGPWQWEGLPGEFNVGQAGRIYPREEPEGSFRFFPVCGL